MFRVIKEKGESKYEHQKTRTIYSELRGGFCWPGGLPGFICIMGQEYENGTVRLFNEDYYKSLDDLARRCGSFKELWHIDEWLADYKKPENRDFEDIFRDIGEGIESEVLLVQPRLTENFNLAFELARTRFDQNSLVLLEDGILHNKIKQLKQFDHVTPDLMDKFPEIQVLANVIYEFPSPNEVVEMRMPKDAWDEAFQHKPPSSWMAN